MGVSLFIIAHSPFLEILIFFESDFFIFCRLLSLLSMARETPYIDPWGVVSDGRNTALYLTVLYAGYISKIKARLLHPALTLTYLLCITVCNNSVYCTTAQICISNNVCNLHSTIIQSHYNICFLILFTWSATVSSSCLCRC